MKGVLVMICAVLLLLAGCGQEKMEDSPRYETYEPAAAWPDNMSARRPPPGTVARDQDIGGPPDEMPMPITMKLLRRGETVYEINCVPCHGAVGYGHGMVVQRGFPEPPSYHSTRLRQVAPSYIFHVITEGYGVMYSYADRVAPRDRWAVAAYIKALQLSQHTKVETLADEERHKLKENDQHASSSAGARSRANDVAAGTNAGQQPHAQQGISRDKSRGQP